jgi:hypothetical protein
LKVVCWFTSSVPLKVVRQWKTNIMHSSETGDIGWETKYEDMRVGTKDKYSTRESEEQRTGPVEFRATKKGTLGQLIDWVQRTGDKEQSHETGNRDTKQGT